MAAPSINRLRDLPEELLRDVLESLDRATLLHFQSASTWAYDIATPLLWREVLLTDCRTDYGELGRDDHDDTPLIKKLILLATRPDLARHVHTLVHQCHLPPPAIFGELPYMPFSAQTLSTDPRTIKLVGLAARNLQRVSTLRVIFGHPNLTDALLRGLFDRERAKCSPVRRLWVENCRINAGCNLDLDSDVHGLPLRLDFEGLESVRFRRMPLRPGTRAGETDGEGKLYVHARSMVGSHPATLQDGGTGTYITGVNTAEAEQRAGEGDWGASTDPDPYAGRRAGSGDLAATVTRLQELMKESVRFDAYMYDALKPLLQPVEEAQLHYVLPSGTGLSQWAYRGPRLDPEDLESLHVPLAWKRQQREKLPSSVVAVNLLHNASKTLTSLNLDWVFTSAPKSAVRRDERSLSIFFGLFALRFPHLKAFQFRNAVTRHNALPAGLYLLDDGCGEPGDDEGGAVSRAALAFMEAHQHLTCLSWPMDRFFRAPDPRRRRSARAEAVICSLARSLLDLRVDYRYTGNHEPVTDDSSLRSASARGQRRRFIEEFAARMTNVQRIKVEGGVPRDEQREVLRALHACALKKIVLIGIKCPIGNTWGENGMDIPETSRDESDFGLEGEDKEAVWRSVADAPAPPRSDFQYRSEYGWPPGPPLIHTIAAFHASTATELKFCGYKGAPLLHSPLPVTTPLLAPLKHFHNLQSLIISFWLLKDFENLRRDEEIISYWLDARRPASTALVLVDPDQDGEESVWARELSTKYKPSAMAGSVASIVGPHLSEGAKSRDGGVHVRASFCLGIWGAVFDMDVRIGKDNVCLAFCGPREELDRGKRKAKLEARRWF